MKPRSETKDWKWSATSRKLTPSLGAMAISACMGCSAVMDQGLSEPIAIRNCYAAIRDNKIKSTNECSEYAQRHLKLYTEIDQSAPDGAACGFSEYALAYAKRMHPNESQRAKDLEKQREKDCSLRTKGWTVRSEHSKTRDGRTETKFLD